MCGITGYVGSDTSNARPHVEDMVALLRHRGPDDVGKFGAARALLGQSRLAVVDPIGGRQPWHDAAGNCLVFNGEVYNSSVLAQRFNIKQLSSRSDTEILFRLLRDQGAQALGHVEGMFAFGYWDASEQTLTLARDRFGEKPLFVFPTSQGVYFASDDGVLVKSGVVPKSVSMQHLGAFLAYRHVPANASIWTDVEAVPPGHVWTFDSSGRVLARDVVGWNHSVTIGESLFDGQTVDLVAALVSATQAELMADAAVGIFLSGGIDSSSVALAARTCGADLDAFTLATGSNGADLDAARTAASSLGMRLHERHVFDDEIPDLASDAASAFGSPFADSSAPLVLALARFAGREVKVALGGDGADELLHGYRDWIGAGRQLDSAGSSRMRQLRWLATTPSGRAYLRKLRWPVNQSSVPPFPTSALQHHMWQTSVFKPDEIVRIVGSESAKSLVEQQLRQAGSSRNLDEHLRGEYLTGDILTKSDRLTMAASLELRSPFLHPAVIASVFDGDVSAQGRAAPGKGALVDWLRSEIPEGNWCRPKMGFGAPVFDWLRGPLAEIVRDLVSSPGEPIWGLVDVDVAGPVLLGTDHKAWSILTLALWSRGYL